MSNIKAFSEINETDIELVGGKGLSLGRLSQVGLPVPSGFVITTDMYRTFRNSETGPETENELYKAFDALGVERVAVRSSAIAEDSPNASWAGQFESYLNVGRERFLDSVKKCWESASSDTVRAYAESTSTDKHQLAIAVVVQKMVSSDVSGVAFSVNPITNNADEVMIEAIFGLGELLVQGMITPDNYVIRKSSFEITDKTIKTKPNRLVYRNGDNIEEPVPEAQSNESCLNNDQINEITRMVVGIEEFYQSPQDVEWALEAGTFYIVQSRPITTIGTP